MPKKSLRSSTVTSLPVARRGDLTVPGRRGSGRDPRPARPRRPRAAGSQHVQIIDAVGTGQHPGPAPWRSWPRC